LAAEAGWICPLYPWCPQAAKECLRLQKFSRTWQVFLSNNKIKLVTANKSIYYWRSKCKTRQHYNYLQR
jgi:hypothetical protein